VSCSRRLLQIVNQSRDPIVETAIRRGVAAAEREDYHQALQIFSTIYSEDSTEPIDGLSHYGLCLALIERKYKSAIALCQRAIALQFYNSVHYANATKVFLAAGNRKRAVEVLEQGLKRLPKDPILVTLRERIGWRRGNIIPFLSRDNTVNVFLGRRRAQSRRTAGSEEAYAEQRKAKRSALFYVAAVIGVIAYLALCVGIFFWIVE
jgi:tetratricopeptide (TPR) repeat protein